MKHIIALCLVLFCSYIVQAQEYFSINTDDGLSENNVRNITQLPDGRMVITTNGLINIYNGTNFSYMHFKESDIYPLKSYDGFHHSYLDESGRMWLKISHGLILIDFQKDKVESNLNKVLKELGFNYAIADFFIDNSKNLWFVTRDDKLYVYDVKRKKTNLFLTQASFQGNKKDQLKDIALIDGKLLFFYKSGTHVCYNYATKRKIYVDTSMANLISGNYDRTVYIIPCKHSFLQMQNGPLDKGILLNYQLNTHKWKVVLQTNYWLNTLDFDVDGSIKVCCKKGLWNISPNLKDKRFESNLKTVEGTNIATEISTIYQDSEGGSWIGTLDRGLLYSHPKRYLFKNFGKTLFRERGLKGINVQGFAMADADNMLVATNQGLFKYSLKKSELSPLSGFPLTNCISLVQGKGSKVWVCTSDRGFFSIQNGLIRHYELPGKTINSVFELPDGQLALCLSQGVCAFNPFTGKISPVKSKNGLKIIGAKQLVKLKNNLLLGLDAEGLFIYDWTKGTLSLVKGMSEKYRAANFSRYNSICVDHRGWIWLATQDGLQVWNPKNNQMVNIHTEDGLVNNSVQSVFEDARHTMWVTTANGMSQLTVSNDFLHYAIENYNHYDGIIQGEFLPDSHFITPSGELFIGGIDGFNRVNLNHLHSMTLPGLTPLFVGLKVNDKFVKCDSLYDGNRILEQSITTAEEITLNYDQNFITLEFCALNYINSTHTRYRYKLEGVDNDWREINTKDGLGRASYTNLSPGTYHFYVCASYNGKNWENGKMVSMIITVRHPWWATPFACFIYIVLILIILFAALYYYSKWKKQQMMHQQKEKLDEMKYRFFTNISHEFRTPLTLILTPLGALIKDITDEKLKLKLASIYKNAQELLTLINQLLDFRKLEAKGESLNLTYGDIVQMLNNVYQSFQPLAAEKGIQFTWKCDVPQLYAYFDKDKIRKILNNLLSNSFKFTETGGEIKLIAVPVKSEGKAPALSIIVSDTGCGIKKEDIPHIFGRFYQTGDSKYYLGSGIGLHLVKEYVSLHGGEISVQSEWQKGTTFSMMLPTMLKPFVDQLSMELPVLSDTTDKQNNSVQPHMHTILLVEDNDEFLHFMKEQLEGNYRIIIASDGVEGEDMALSYSPDLIISDVMMPRKDGLELCRDLKEDVRTSHIPIILLTAYTSNEKELFGYKSGADEFISKPFSMDILLLKIQKLIREQDARKELFAKKIEVKPSELTITSLDEELIQKAIVCVERNMNNTEYTVELFSSDMNMERTVLYRKLQSVAGLPPSEFIRTIRLKRAAQLLESHKYNVTEVAGMVGFATPKYFTKYFKEAFGVLPSQYGAK
ncbi:ATP-binding protein [uncultured Bacteroides sp.]|uniref:hybrid sensor histidine kinase/response regulator transcription factor n=1 Tax=uncultured Bacteroides sp. TaxID=162156 RepID=UPI002AAB9B2A|nr:ATP-binding protein [uncultured Bacteroides sp.]